MGSTVKIGDDTAVACLLWNLKSIATKEVENLPHHTVDSFLSEAQPSSTPFSSHKSEEEGWFRSDIRSRTVSLDSRDCFVDKSSILSMTGKQSSSNVSSLSSQTDSGYLDHHDWSNREESFKFRPSRMKAKSIPTTKVTKGKSEGFVGQTTKSGVVRATLRRKFSWKQYPELENFLLANQEDYFEYSSRNYTAEQRNYNNTLTRGLLDLASTEGYTFEEFTFAQVRDRIRCYFKSYSQSAKKKRKGL